MPSTVAPRLSRLSPAHRIAAAALLVAAAYYAGANLGIILRFPPSVPSVVWPPNSILTATLLLAAPRRWWIYLLAALPAHLAAELHTFPTPLVLALYATNCSEALLAAVFVRRFNDAPARVDTLRRVVVYILGAGLIAPFLSSFADAFAVSSIRGDPYWLVWHTRCFSNVLTELTVAPAILTTACAVQSGGALSPRRRLEAALLAASLLGVAVLVFTGGTGSLSEIKGSARVACLFPFLLWAAVRFGALGDTLALLATALVATWGATHSRGPFTQLPVGDYVPSLQIFLSVLAIPLLCLAALIEERRCAEAALRASELIKSAILSSLSNGVAVLDRAGRIIAVNDSWTRLRSDPHEMPWAGMGLGADSLAHCRQAAAQGDPHAATMALGIEHVLAGVRSAFSLEASSPGGERWFAISVVPLNRPEGGAVVSHTDVTERKRAEIQAQQSRQQLAHFARVSTMGELTASLAHELRQPLTGIMSNAQAARRFLNSTPVAVDDVRACLEDIIADDRRASESIQRVRAFLHKGGPAHAPLDLNDLVVDVTRLLDTDAILRSTALAVEPSRSPALVKGDRVQLEQVMLNLLVNALDAMAEVPQAQRMIVVRTGSALSDVHVEVQDAGPGLGDGASERLFEPFYTTKPAGMGMGLSIARSIVEAHGGRIWATNNQGRGATFHFTLPAAEGRAS